MRRQFACWLFVLLAPAAAAAPPQISVRRDADAYLVQAEAELAADRRTAWLTLTDYGQLPQFVPGIHSAQVLARVASGDTERLLVEQSGELRFLWFAQPVQVWLDVIHEAPERVLARSVLPSGVSAERSTLREFEGSYVLSEIAGSRTRLAYRARIEPARSLPPVLGTMILRQAAGEQFRALVGEIERRAARQRIDQAAR